MLPPLPICIPKIDAAEVASVATSETALAACVATSFVPPGIVTLAVKRLIKFNIVTSPFR